MQKYQYNFRYYKLMIKNVMYFFIYMLVNMEFLLAREH